MELRQKIEDNLRHFYDERDIALERANRLGDTITTIIVTKYQPVEVFPILHALGIQDVGESRVQDGVERRGDIGRKLPFRWHMIGTLQKNKIQKALTHFDAIHSIDSLDLARAVGKVVQNSTDILSHQFFLQVNPLMEPSKHGFSLEELRRSEIFAELQDIFGASLVGLMAMAPQRDQFGDRLVHEAFSKIEKVFMDLSSQNKFFTKLSMGMSQDFDIALQYGATHLRIGRRIFD